MVTTEVGKKAEEAVAKFLKIKEYDILDKNWRTKTCEIDLIAHKDKIVFFVEVKYRTNSAQGTGFEYINFTKLRQMEYAAKLWVAKKRWKGDFCLSAASVLGTKMKVDFIEQVYFGH